MKPIAFCGFKHVGKTYTVKKLAARLGLKHIDLDEILEKKFKATISDLFRDFKETRFREEEYHALKDLDLGSIQLISLGGGTVFHSQALQFLKNHTHLVLLEAQYEQIENRILNQKSLWPALDPQAPVESLKMLFETRNEFYQNLDIPKLSSQPWIQLEDYVRQYFR